MKTVTSVEAQNNFGKLLDTVQREVVTVTRHGRPAAFLVSPADMADLLDNQRKRASAVADFEAWRQNAAKNMSPVATELTDEDIVQLVHDLR